MIDEKTLDELEKLTTQDAGECPACGIELAIVRNLVATCRDAIRYRKALEKISYTIWDNLSAIRAYDRMRTLADEAIGSEKEKSEK